LRIDAHHSFSERYTLAYLESILERNRFEGSILVGPLIDTPDFVRGIVVPVSEWNEDLIRHPKFRGVQVDHIPALPDPLFDELARSRIPVDVRASLDAVPRLAELYANLPIVIDHLGADAPIEAAARFPMVYCKLNGLTMLPAPKSKVQHALRVFGPARLMFGSDWPNAQPQYSWKATLALFTQCIGPQTIETREQLLGGTAARFYGI
jgi:L-fuconolactonase